jgi:thioesterase domain-containing protein/acyl carrier protein
MSSGVDEVISRLVGILREEVFGDPDRHIAVDEPLGEQGVGLDSLALVQFLTAVEQEFSVQLPVDVWSVVDEISLLECTAAITGARSRAGTELELTRIWEDLLEVGPISPHDSFLHLQGDRDLFQDMLARTRLAFGVLAEGLPIEEILEQPTIAALAKMIDDSDDLNSPALVVPLQASGDQPPLFLVHAGAGYGFFYRALASSLAPDRPVYAIRAARQGDTGGESFVEASSVEAVAARYVREIKAIRPEGPYALGGACVGGVFAFEMAQQLRDAGDEVLDPIVLFDSFINNKGAGFRGYAALRAYDDSVGTHDLMRPSVWWRGRYRLWTLRSAGLAGGSLRLVRSLARRSRAAAVRLVTHLRRGATSTRQSALLEPASGPAVRDGTQALDRQRAELMEASMDAALSLVMAYQPRQFEGRIVYFSGADTADIDLCWRGLATGGLDVVECPGGHLDMLEHPAVVQTASAVAAALGTAAPKG